MIVLQIDAKQVKRLSDAVGKAGKKFSRELASAINAVSKKTKLQIGRDIRSTVALGKQEAEKPLSIRASASAENLQAIVTLRKTDRLGLRHFGARQDQRGVTYKIDKKGGRKRINGAFQGPRPGVMNVKWKGNVFFRIGKERLPIKQAKAVSPWGAYIKNGLQGPQIAMIEAELSAQMERRINLNILRASGLVKK